MMVWAIVNQGLLHAQQTLERGERRSVVAAVHHAKAGHADVVQSRDRVELFQCSKNCYGGVLLI